MSEQGKASRLSGIGTILKKTAGQIVFPDLCAVCSVPLTHTERNLSFCRNCLAQLPLRSAAERGIAWPDGTSSRSINDDIICAAYYRPPIDTVLLRLKFSDAPHLARPLAGLLFRILKLMSADWDAVVAVPLHPARLRQRGYNQSGLITESLAELLRIPDGSPGLTRIRITAPQSERLDRKARHANLAGAFCADPEFWQRQPLSRGSVLLIDDVMTTGATMLAAAQPLLRLGLRVTGLVVASEHGTVGQAADRAFWR